MTKIKFLDRQGNEVSVEVNDEFAAVYVELDRQDKNNERKETRRHVSLNKKVKNQDFEDIVEHIDLLEDKRSNIEENYIQREEIATLRDGIKSLLPEQRRLIEQVFYEERSIKSLAEEYGVSSPAIINRLNKIYAQLRKKF